MRGWRGMLMTMIVALLLVPVVQGQEATPEATDEPLPVAPQRVEVEAEDKLDLVGEFYLVAPEQPTVLLLHQLYDTRLDWRGVVRPLLEHGYNVLAVDIRGFGETRGALNWRNATDDVGVWMTWLREDAGVHPARIATMGSSIGSSLAVVGCADDDLCRTSIALSPGWNYYGVALQDALPTKPVLAIYAENDRWPALGIPRMQEAAPETLTTVTYPGNAHGMALVDAEFETVMAQVLHWLATHTG